jgi:hypothetical protein
MRIGLRLGGAIGWSIAATVSIMSALGATADPVQRVPLGGSVANQVGDLAFGVYVPTKFGGVLTVKSTSGTVESIVGPDRRERRNGEEIGNDAVGWYTFRVVGAEKDKPYTVETTFVQVGQAARMPWNFYYWPTKSDAIHEPWAGGNGRVDTYANPNSDDVQVIPFGSYVAPGQDIVRAGPNGLLETAVSPGDDSTWFPNLYDDLTFRGADGTWYQTPSPLLKYDQIFGASARNFEAGIQNHDIQRWPGHCLGGAIASIMLAEPRPVPNSGLTQDELKSLWAELGENHYNHQIGDNANAIPAGPPRPGFDPTDAFVPRFHQMLETHIRAKRQALLGNLRGFPPTGKANEVWNHGIGKYTAKLHSLPGNERRVRIELELVANSGSNLNNSDNKPRINTYEYILVYGANGMVDETAGSMADWISVGGEAMFAPLNLMEVLNSKWGGHNSMVTEDRVRQLDLANGGTGLGRLSATAPTFRPVGSYEAGRGPSFARNGNPDSPSTRRGFFRIFGR